MPFHVDCRFGVYFVSKLHVLGEDFLGLVLEILVHINASEPLLGVYRMAQVVRVANHYVAFLLQ